MTREAREARQDRGIVLLLQALPADRLAGILERLGVPAEKTASVTAKPKRDDRRCTECGHGYYLCRVLDEKSADDHHPWSPDRPRTIPAQGES